MKVAKAEKRKLPGKPSEPRKEGIAGFLNPAEMHKLGRLSLLSRYVVEGSMAGAHRSPMKGASSEFADHKAYGIGDDPKHIDWRVLARTDKYYIKRYEDETNLRVYLSLDRSNSMNYGSGDVTKYDFACHLAAALGYITVKNRDSIGLFLHADKVDMKMDARNSFVHLNNMLKHVQEQPPSSETGLAETLHQIAGSVRRRALIVIISDFLGDEEAIAVALAHLRKQRHDVIVFHVLDPMEIDLSMKHACEFEDLETGKRLTVNPRAMLSDYQKIFGAFLERIQKTCAGLKIDYRVARSDQNLETFVRAYLEERRRLSK
ncbi:MAG: DUF58 domain-containing protein [Verrucomicrobia bacterium]|jgi:uncharacterized protein (DUF58 family)|nr:DUF58 domain-containing protein [Verrucomicrobiota bacterium]